MGHVGLHYLAHLLGCVGTIIIKIE